MDHRVEPAGTLLGLALWSVALCCACATEVGDRAPDWTLIDIHGQDHSLSRLRGDVVVLDFWATWCAPCLPVGDHMQALHETFAGEPVTVVGVHFDDAGEPAAWAARHGHTYTSLRDGRDVARSYGVTKIPTVLVVDTEGKVVHRQTGFASGDEKRLERIVRRALGDRARTQ